MTPTEKQIEAALSAPMPDGLPVREYLEMPTKLEMQGLGICTDGYGISDIREDIIADYEKLLIGSALSAALAVEAGTVGVKTLEWRKFERGHTARTPFHDVYGILPWYELSGDWAVRRNGKEIARTKDEQTAQAAAQADYEARILSALTTSPASSERPCTCHPDDNPPSPCAERYAYSECVAAASPASSDDGRCPRPCNDRPGDSSMRACIEAGECGCIAFPASSGVEGEAVAVPNGWRLVPVEPTREMWAAMADTLYRYKNRHHDKVAGDLFKAMLSALPAAPSLSAGAGGEERG